MVDLYQSYIRREVVYPPEAGIMFGEVHRRLEPEEVGGGLTTVIQLEDKLGDLWQRVRRFVGEWELKVIGHLGEFRHGVISVGPQHPEACFDKYLYGKAKLGAPVGDARRGP